MNMKNALLATAFGLGLASTASSQEVVRISGSTAFRSAVHNAILTLMSGETWAFNNAALNSATQANFRGTLAGHDVLIKCSWSGSVTGIQSLTAPASRVDLFLADSVLGNSSGLANVASGTADEEADIAMSDVFQGSTVHTAPELLDNLVAVAPFKIVAGKGAPASLTNITSLGMQSLYGAGKIPLGLITGVNADRTVKLYALGRDNGSGTRLVTLADSGVGALSTVIQYFFDGAAYTVQGNGGYASGGAMVGALTATSTAALGYNIGYVGTSDAANAILGGAKELTYNGVLESDTAVREGSYTLWGYEHLFTKDDISGTAADVASALVTQITAVPGSSGITLSSMGVSRVSEGASVGNKYPTP